MMDFEHLLPQMEEKKRCILIAALSSFMEKGLNRTSMNDIVAKSGLSKGGVYHYFASKDDVIEGVMRAMFEKNQEFLALALQQFPSVKAKTEFMLEQALNMAEGNLEFTHLTIEMFSYSAHHPKFAKILSEFYWANITPLARLLESGKATGEIKEEVDCLAIAMTIIGVFDGVGIASTVVASEINVRHTVKVGVSAILASIFVNPATAG